jgi:hypothetical protein
MFIPKKIVRINVRIKVRINVRIKVRINVRITNREQAIIRLV